MLNHYWQILENSSNYFSKISVFRVVSRKAAGPTWNEFDFESLIDFEWFYVGSVPFRHDCKSKIAWVWTTLKNFDFSFMDQPGFWKTHFENFYAVSHDSLDTFIRCNLQRNRWSLKTGRLYIWKLYCNNLGRWRSINMQLSSSNCMLR